MASPQEQTPERFDITFIGHFSKDVIIALGKTVTAPGGAVFYGSIPAARIGVRAAVVTRAARADFHMLKPMEDAGALVFAIPAEETTGIQNRYFDETLERRECTPLGFAGAYKIEDFPLIESSVYHVAGLVRGEVDLDLLRALASRGRLSADAQGFVRVIRGDKMVSEDWPEKRGALPLLAFFKTDAAEAEILTGRSDVREAARELAGWGAREIVLTHPGGVLVLADGEFTNIPFTARNLSGRTGRGDTVMSSYLSRRLTHNPADSCAFAAALCSIKMETPGPFAGIIEDVIKRMG